MNDPPAPLDRRPRDGTTYLLLPFHGFFTHTLTGRRREAGRRSGQPQDDALSLQPKNRACLPSPALPQLPSFRSTCHAVDGGACLPPQTPGQLGSMFALSISLSNGTVPAFPLRPPVGLGTVSPLRKRLGPSLQPLWRPLVSSVSATVWVKRALPLPLREPAGRDGGFFPHAVALCPL